MPTRWNRRASLAIAATLVVGGLTTPALAAAGRRLAGADSPTAPAASPATTSVTLPAPTTGKTLASGTRLDDDLVSKLEAASTADVLRVFVHAGDATTARTAAATSGLRVLYSLDRVGVVAASGTRAAIEALAATGAASYLEADKPIRFDLDHTHEATRGEEARHVFQTVAAPEPSSKKAKKANRARKRPGSGTTFTPAFAQEIDGRGIGVAIIDSGADGSHPFFQRADGTSQVRRNLRETCEEIEVQVEGVCAAAGIDGIFVDAPNNDSDTMALGGHGTHVTGIVGGVDTTVEGDRKLHGAAPGADLVVLGVGRTLFITGAVPALEWVLENHADPCGDGSCAAIRVINNSWSADWEYDPEDVINKLQRALIADGVTVVWAASNDGGDGTKTMTNGYGQEPTPGSIMVANYDDGDSGARDNALDSSSSRGLQGDRTTYPDISAPGTHVLSACRIYLPVCSTGLDVVENGDYNSITGTSMAAPHIAGIVAQLLQVNPNLTPAEIEDVLEDTAHRFIAGGPYEPELDDRNAGTLTSFDKGHGLVDVVAAVGRILGVTAPAATPQCATAGPVLTDPAGDATGVISGVGGTPNESSLDVRTLTFSTTASELVATLTVDDLPDAPSPTTGEGEYFDINFTHDGRDFYLSARRAPEPTFALGYYDTTRTGVDDAAVTGTFDPATETITVRLPRGATADANAVTPVGPLDDNDVLTKIEVVARRSLVAVIPDADTAPSGCAYTVGVGNGTPPAPAPTEAAPAPSSDATLSPGQSYSYSGPTTTGAQEPTGLGGIVGLGEFYAEGEGTVAKLVSTTASGTLKVVLSSDVPADFDLEVYDAATGKEVGTSGNVGSDEVVEKAVPAGQYRIVVRAYTTVSAVFTAVASLA